VPPPAAVPPDRRRGRRQPWWFAVPVVAALAVFGLAHLRHGGRDSSQPGALDPAQPAGAAAGERALVRFEVTPTATRVFLDGLQLATNPVSLLKGERHIVTAVAEGYQMVEQEFQVRDAMVLRLKLERERSHRHP
jgi:hypothetical protein